MDFKNMAPNAFINRTFGPYKLQAAAPILKTTRSHLPSIIFPPQSLTCCSVFLPFLPCVHCLFRDQRAQKEKKES